MNKTRQKRGMALVMVLLLCMVMLVMIGAMFYRVSGQKVMTPHLYEETKALFLAKGVTQLAMYKVKVLPADFYRASILFNKGNAELMQEWMNDLNPGDANSLLGKVVLSLPDIATSTYECGIPTYSIRLQDFGFKKDLLRIQVSAKCNGREQKWESLVEMDIKVDTF